MNKSWRSYVQVIYKSKTICEKIVKKFWTSPNKSWKSCEKNIKKLWTSPEQNTIFFLNKSWTNQLWKVMNKSQTNHGQVIDKSWTSLELVMNKSESNHEQVLNKLWRVMRSLSNLSNYLNSELLSWVGGWLVVGGFKSVMILRLS